MKVIIFDLGCTLMKYKGIPDCWVDYYQTAFNHIKEKFNIILIDRDIKYSCEKLTQLNARINYRENEYTPEFVFNEATSHWKNNIPVETIIFEFFRGIKLVPMIYNDTLPCLDDLKRKGYKLSVLTDLPTGMPDYIMKRDFPQILEKIDLYVSSVSCGFRKPNKFGIEYIAKYFNVKSDDMIFIGDEQKDIKAAKNAECHSVLINRSKEDIDYGQDYTIFDLSELNHCLNDK